jgi:hypothetical protein
MSKTNVAESRVTVDVAFLIDLFDHHNVDWKSWKVKTLDNLVDDLSKSERTITYTNGEIALNSRVVSCEIYFGGKQLIETQLKSPTGTLNRNIPCGGKLALREDPRGGMIRELKEELGLDLEPTYLGVTKEERHQSYYPGLLGVVTHYRFATPLHPNQYKESYVHTEGDITFTFNWVDANDLLVVHHTPQRDRILSPQLSNVKAVHVAEWMG